MGLRRLCARTLLRAVSVTLSRSLGGPFYTQHLPTEISARKERSQHLQLILFIILYCFLVILYNHIAFHLKK